MLINRVNVCVCVQRGELNDLQKKSPEDLWKEDLTVFIEELDVSLFVAVYCFLKTRIVRAELNNTEEKAFTWNVFVLCCLGQ